MKIISLVLAFALVAGGVQAADLAELQEQALANRAVIQRYAADLARSEENETLASSALYPSLDLAYTATWLDEASIYEDKQTGVASGAISWNIFAGFRDRYNIKSAKLLRQAEAYRLQGVRQDVKLVIALRYLEIYNRQANLKVAEDSASTLGKLYEDGVNRFEVGLIKKSEMLKFKVDLDHAVIVEKKARAELAKSIALLQRETGSEVDLTRLLFNEFTDLPDLQDQAAYEEDMLNKRSEIKLLEETLGAATMQVKVARAGYYPRVDLAGKYSKYDNNPLGTTGDDDEIRTQLTLSMNIFAGFAVKSRVSAARFAEQGLRYDLEEVKRDFKVQLRNLFFDYRVSDDNVVVAANSIEQAEENLRVNRLSYDEGVSTESELLDAITNLSRAKFNFVAAKSEGFANYFQIIRAVEGL
ncbi:MAG: TolC family protein [Thermodesulfobacteriota bacterium]